MKAKKTEHILSNVRMDVALYFEARDMRDVHTLYWYDIGYNLEYSDWNCLVLAGLHSFAKTCYSDTYKQSSL